MECGLQFARGMRCVTGCGEGNALSLALWFPVIGCAMAEEWGTPLIKREPCVLNRRGQIKIPSLE